MANKKHALVRIIIVALLYITATILHYTLQIAYYIELPIFIALYLAISFDILWGAARNIVHGKVFDENFLMTIATIGAFVIGEYVDAVAVMLLYQVGELFQSYAVDKSRKSIAQLMNICPSEATLYNNGNPTTVNPEEVGIDDIIMVRAGEKIALDGVVVEGESHIDTSALTGEYALQAVGVGDKVLSGSINSENVLLVKVTAKYEDSTVSRILQLVEEASDNKSKSENFITKFSRYYTPIVVVAALMLLVPAIFDGQWYEWARRAMMFLFVSCPCALVISVPMAFFGGIGCASSHGILVKGGNYLEKLSHTRTYVMDKTGTITQGKFDIDKVIPQENSEQIVQYAAIAESCSTHPIAVCISAKAKGNIDYSNYSFSEQKGKGVKATSKDGQQTILCGNAKFLQENGIQFEVNEDLQYTATAVYVAVNNKYIGSIIISDKIKSDSVEAIRQLKHYGAKTVILTGDNQANAQHIATLTGVDKYYAQLLPQDKVKKLEEIIQNRSKGENVAFVGDGINDAPALMRADVGIAMGAIGSDAAIEAADIVLVNDNLTAIPTAKRIADKTVAIAKQNIAFALTIKIAVLILSATGIVTSLILAILADVGVSVLAIINALRTLKLRKSKRKGKAKLHKQS